MNKKSKKENNINNKKSAKYILLNILFLIFLVIFIFSGIKIIQWFLNNNENEKIKKSLSNYVEYNNTKTESEEQEYKIDFESLKKINPDTVAWLKVNNTNIEYIVVKTENNKYYLKHNFEKKENVAGWTFADYKNKFDHTDYNIIIYGHNMKNGSMFGTLSDTLKEKWYNNEENKYITLVTDNETIKYEIFSIYEEKASDYPIQTEFANDGEFLDFIKTIKNKSINNFNVDISTTKSILTLSTCGDNSTNRVVLHAKKL